MNLSIELCMFIASSNGNTSDKEEVIRLLTSGADINFQDANRNFNTPLHLAIERRNFVLLRLLLKFNPSFKIRNMNGERPRDFALNQNHFDIVEVLDEHRATWSSKDKPSTSRDHNILDKSDSTNVPDKESFDSGVSLEVQSDFRTKSFSTLYTSSRVQFLLSISKIDPHFKRTSFDMEAVKLIYAKLDENIMLRPLLKIAREIKSLEVYFLFNQENDELSSCSIKEPTGTIFIYGPQNGSAFPATLAHKLLHYAMNHINDNDCKPYRRKQAEKMFRFRKIVTVYKRRIETLNPVVQRVFELPEVLWDAELIACIPYFHATFNDDPATLIEITESHKELFDFYYEVVLKDIDDHLVQSNYKKFRGRPVEGSSFGKKSHHDPYKNERLEEKYGSNYRDNKRNNRSLERVCAVM